VITWGDAGYGGNSEEVREQLAVDVVSRPTKRMRRDATGLPRHNPHVKHIYSTRFAFAAVNSDGSVITWGAAPFGGNSSEVREQLAADVQHVHSTDCAFAAVKSGGGVITWGLAQHGGNSDGVREQLA